MNTISQRELRNGSAAVMDAVARGETFRITRRGMEIAELRPATADVFALVAEIKKTFARMPAGDYAAMRAESDAVFGADRVGE